MERLEVIADFDWLEGEKTVGYLCYEQLSGENIRHLPQRIREPAGSSDAQFGGTL